jgi:hypothetical protein
VWRAASRVLFQRTCQSGLPIVGVECRVSVSHKSIALTDDAGYDIGHIGGSPASIGGGDMKTLTPGKSFIENCHIWDFARINRC